MKDLGVKCLEWDNILILFVLTQFNIYHMFNHISKELSPFSFPRQKLWKVFYLESASRIGKIELSKIVELYESCLEN